MKRKYVKLSKKMSLALRHNPGLFNITLDDQGWTDMGPFTEAMECTLEDIAFIQRNSEKQRFDVQPNRIRAFYGHSKVDIRPIAEPPPEFLYHGTTPDTARAIVRGHFKPMKRKYVHWSTDFDTAVMVGKRRCPDPIILRIRANDIHNYGYRFYHGNEDIWMSEKIPGSFAQRARE
jgi:putative RNA 2'-phosphotransferase